MSETLSVSQSITAQSRIFMRSMGHFVLDEMARLTDRGSGDVLKGLAELSIIQATRPVAGSDSAQQRTVSVRAIADPLSMPSETCRRKVLELQMEGRCQRVTANRLTMTPGHLETPPTRPSATLAGAVSAAI